jgi:hypothetical protein
LSLLQDHVLMRWGLWLVNFMIYAHKHQLLKPFSKLHLDERRIIGH